MDRIASFTINHLDLMPGLYVSRRDAKGDCVTTTFDLRITAPNREPVVDTPALHTIEHLAATYLRNSEKKDDVIYFGPMGCRTGCYLVMFGNLDSEDVLDLVLEMCDFIIGFEGEIPGAAPEQCGNYQEQNLDMAHKDDVDSIYSEQMQTITEALAKIEELKTEIENKKKGPSDAAKNVAEPHEAEGAAVVPSTVVEPEAAETTEDI